MFRLPRLVLIALFALPACTSHDDQPAPVQPSAKASLSGLTTDSSGKALSGVEVSTTPTTSFVLSDAEGGYKLGGVEPGTYTVVASRSGYARVEKPGVVVSAGGSAIVDFQLAPLVAVGDLVGHVTDATTKAPIALAAITTEAVTASVTTGADGSYKLAGIQVGSYKVRATASGYEGRLSDFVTVTAGGTTTVDLALTKATTYDSTCTSCHLRTEQLLADLTADPIPTVIGEGGSAGEG